MKKIFTFLILFHFWNVEKIYSQVINAYARVTAISGTTLTLANVNETFHTFNVGEKAILIQMQSNVLGSTADDATFGNCFL